MNLNINYSDLNEVRKLSDKLGGVVVKYPDRSTYNITLNVERALRNGAQIIHDRRKRDRNRSCVCP